MFSDRLKKIRKEKKVTQEELAKIIGVERSTIGKYESTTTIPSPDILTKLADYFNVSVDYLLGREANSIQADIKKEPTVDDELNERDKRDIAKRLERTLEDIEYNEAMMFDGEPIDDSTKELLRISLENSLKLAKIRAKEKYNPYKNKNKDKE